MHVSQIEFAQLEQELVQSGKSPTDYLATEVGKVYVVAISRDRCPACEKQKPKLEELAKETGAKHGKRVSFVRIRVRHPTDQSKEALRSKEVLGHYFFPTNLILLRGKDTGAFEYYKIVQPRTSELKRNIGVAARVAEMLEKR